VPGNMLFVLGHTHLPASYKVRISPQFLRNTLDVIMTGWVYLSQDVLYV